MNNSYHDLLNYDKWNRRLMNVYWACNGIILIVEIIVALLYFQTPFIPPLPVYIRSFILTPSLLIFLLTAGCEGAVYLLRDRRRNLQPYVVTFTCVAFCAVLLVVHYSVTVIFAAYMLPLFFSLAYNDKRVLSYTFLFSFLVFIAIYMGYFSRSDLPYLNVNVANVPANIAILFVAYLVCRTILNRFEEIISTLMEAERSAYEAETAKNRAEAEAEARSLFLANMSHELRTPMNGVIGFTELALDDLSLSGEARDCLEKIRVSAEGLREIIDNILDISKIKAGKMDLEKVPFSLDDVLRQCEIITAAESSKTDVELYFRADPIDERLLGDPTKLRQALLNLLSNAVKFTDKGAVELTAAADRENDLVAIRFEVRDSGIGMTRDQLQRIFEPFVQADHSTTRKFGGTGLGLSITRDIVEMMGGILRAESAPGLGSRFFFDLRFETAEHSDTVDLEEGNAPGKSESAAFEGNILVCEDNEMNRQVIRKHLEKFGLVPVIASNGRLGLEKYREQATAGQSFDLVFMDIHMPEMDGLEASRRLLELGCKAPIVALTANAMEESRAEYLKNGLSGCLVKPFVSRELYLCLKQYLKAAGALPPVQPEPASGIHNAAEAAGAIDKRLGLESCAGSERLYQKIRTDFLENGGTWCAKLMDAAAAGDMGEAHRMAHTLSGRAAMLGAAKLSQAAREVENALSKDGKIPDGDCRIPGKSPPGFEKPALALERELSAVLDELAEQLEAAHTTRS